MIGRGTVSAAPDLVTEACRGRADIGVAVVSIYAPGASHTLHITTVSRSPDMIHHLVATPLDDSCANFAGECFQYLVPRGTLPFSFTAFACAFQRVEDALRVIDLVDSSRSLGAVAPAAARVIGIALEFFDTARPLIHVSHQATCGLAVEADGRNYRVVFFDFARPCFCIIFDPIVPAVRWWTRGQVSHGHLLSTRSDVLL